MRGIFEIKIKKRYLLKILSHFKSPLTMRMAMARQPPRQMHNHWSSPNAFFSPLSISPQPSPLIPPLLLLPQCQLPKVVVYFFWEKMKRKMTRKPIGKGDCRRKLVRFRHFPDDEFFRLFPTAIKVGKSYHLTLFTESEILSYFPIQLLVYPDGSFGKLRPPISISFTKSLSISFFYIITSPTEQLDTWMQTYAHEFDSLQ